MAADDGGRLIMGGKRIVLTGVFFCSILALIAWTGSPAVPSLPAAGQAPPVSLKPDLAIGVEDGDENLMFGEISRIDLDAKGNIYVLDYKFRKITVLDPEGKLLRTIAVAAGQGPREATNLNGIAVTPGGTLFINDMQKVIAYGPNGGKILHVFDPAGKLLASFGDTFTPPGEFAPMKDMPMFGAPLIFNCAKDGRIFVLNPHKYEVSVFKDRKLERTIAGSSELFKPLQKMGRGIVSTAAHIVASGDLVFVAFQNPDPNAQKTADVFQAGKQIGAVEFPGTPYNVDAQGRIYFAETEGFPRVVRYAVVK
jgi:hypothetical protein